MQVLEILAPVNTTLSNQVSLFFDSMPKNQASVMRCAKSTRRLVHGFLIQQPDRRSSPVQAIQAPVGSMQKHVARVLAIHSVRCQTSRHQGRDICQVPDIGSASYAEKCKPKNWGPGPKFTPVRGLWAPSAQGCSLAWNCGITC